MDLPAIVLLVVVPLVLVAVILEGRRQTRKYGKGSDKGQAMLRAGLMEVQNLLEPERKIEVIRDAERRDELLVQLDAQGGPPDGSTPRRGSPRAGGDQPPRGS